MESIMDERERMRTVPMGVGTKQELFEQGHPVIRELKTIPEIIFEEQLSLVPSSSISLKNLFIRKQMDHYHVDSLILKKIAWQVLHILTEISQRHIYPGLIGLDDLYVDMDNSQFGVFLVHPEKFQLLEYEQDYEWYPEEEKMFGEKTLFDANAQKMADNRLLYKILIASSRGNVKIPPVRTEMDYSELFFNILPEEWKQIFEKQVICDYRQWQEMLREAIRTEEDFARQTRQSLEEREKKAEDERARKLQEKRQHAAGEKKYHMFVILRTELHDPRKISKLLYLLQEEIEAENALSGCSCYQAFVFGNGAVQVREFQTYYTGFRCQFAQNIREYSAGETLVIAADLLKEQQKKLFHSGKDNSEIYLHILLDGRIKNDKIFKIALEKLQERKEAGVKMQIRTAEDVFCEASQKLKNMVEGEKNGNQNPEEFSRKGNGEI